SDIPVIIVMNKVDKVKKLDKIEANLISYKTLFDKNYPVVRVSAKTGRNIDTLIKNIYKNLNEGELLYPEDVVTEETMRDVAQEIIREKILLNTSDEIPHSTAVKVESYLENEDMDRIYATIYCETKSQKGILIGKGGSLLKKIGTEARLELEKIADKKIFLGLEVKVEKDWRKKQSALKQFGYGV
ncbi:GTPase Era, partial [bacterium]|nr:GTPase Era [bacterium]